MGHEQKKIKRQVTRRKHRIKSGLPRRGIPKRNGLLGRRKKLTRRRLKRRRKKQLKRKSLVMSRGKRLVVPLIWSSTLMKRPVK